MNHLKHYNRWADLPHDGKKAARRPTIGSVNLFIAPSLRPKQESDKTAVEAPPNGGADRAPGASGIYCRRSTRLELDRNQYRRIRGGVTNGNL